jgi:elongation factor 1-gamma
MSLTLCTYPNNYRAQVAQIVAQYNGLDLKVSDDFKDKSPLGKAPVLQTPQGSLFESGAINRYLARLNPATNLTGSSFFESGLVDQWVEFSAQEVEIPRDMWVLPVQGAMGFNGKAYSEAKKDLAAALKILNAHLLNNQFVVGQQITLADITLATALFDCFTTVFDPKYIKGFGNVKRWFTCCVNQPEFAAVLGEVTFATSEKQAPKPQKSKKKSNKGKNKKQEKKQEKKAAAPKPKPKPKDPMLDLPPSSMNLDVVKKAFFSKRPYDEKFFDTFWDTTFDASGYAVWKGLYKYDAENTQYWLTQNLLQGYLQRMERARKYAFGTMMIYGKDEETAPFKVAVCFIFRSTEFPQCVTDVDDSEYYEWTKMDPTTEADKIKEFFMSETLNGETVLDRRFFK